MASGRPCAPPTSVSYTTSNSASGTAERALIFTADLNRCFGDVEREDWEWAIADAGGSVPDAAVDCGLTGVPRDAKALWGKSAEAARDTYRAWQRKNNGKR